MKNAPILSNQSVSVAANENNTRSTPEILADLRRTLDWLLGFYGLPLIDCPAEKQGGSSNE